MTGCLPPCSGLMLTSFDKNDQNMNLDNILSKELNAYKKFTKWHNFPSELKGLVFNIFKILNEYVHILHNLRF